jgi:DNA processing protein
MTPPTATSRAERDALLTLLLTPGFGPSRVNRCVEAFGSAEATLGVTGDRLGTVRGISPRRGGELKRKIHDTLQSKRADAEREAAAAAGVTLWALADEGYPRLLRLIPDPPPLLWVRGEIHEDDALALGIVGSRKCSHYGREQADRFAAQCVSAGLCVISGGAYGIDIAAHRAALRVQGRTIAVVGSGLGTPYPADHRPTFDRIVGDGAGAVVSELPMATSPTPKTFPRRNRIISGMSLGVLVVEAAKRSGALITARQCVEEHGRECMALPGRVDTPGSAGCHQLIRDGSATLVTSATDVLDQLGEAGQLLKAEWDGEGANAKPQAAAGNSEGASLFEANLTDAQQKVVEAVDEAGRTLDQVVSYTGLAAGAVSADLTMLEIRGVVQRRGGLFVRRRPPA